MGEITMKSLKTKLTVIILVFVLATAIVSTTICLNRSFSVTKDIIDDLSIERLTGCNNMLAAYLEEQYGDLVLSDGALVGKKGNIEDTFEYIDAFSEKMGVVATVFKKNGDSFIRAITTIQDSNGRVVGTELDKTGAAYAAVMNGQSYFGEAKILGSDYMTGYAPMYDDAGSLIGIYFVGMPMSEVNATYNSGLVKALTISVIVLVVMLVVIVVLSIITAKSITRPIENVTVAAQKIADGQFDVELNVQSKDEVGKLADAFKLTINQLQNYQSYIDEIASSLGSVAEGKLSVELELEYTGQFEKLKNSLEELLEKLNSTFSQFNLSSTKVRGDAENLASAAQELSQGATVQANSVEELSATINSVNDQVQKTAENAKTAHESAKRAGDEIGLSNRQMEEMISAMDKINKQSSEISKIINVIEDIAFQTNILAFNAAVEASRAGTAGKSFAIVAEEVRKLAEKTSEAARDTTALITDTLVSVSNGTKIAGTTAASLGESAEATKSAVSLLEEIAQASKEEATAIGQINIAIDQISSVVQTTALTAENSAGSSGELSEQATLLKDLISKFEIRE
jgi:methyl-accepting chemotaxis protein